MSDKKFKVVFGPNTEYERILWIERPKGRKAREMMPKVLAFAAKLQTLSSEEKQDINTIVAMVDVFWGREEFENVLVPYVLGLDSKEGQEFLNSNGTIMEVINAFNEAAGFLINESFSQGEVQAALGKSKDEAQVEEAQ